MKKKTALIVFGLVLVFGGATRCEAQVKRVQMQSWEHLLSGAP